MQDIVLPPWNVPLYHVDGFISEIQVTRHTNVLRYLIPGNTRPISFSSWFSSTFCFSHVILNLTYLILHIFRSFIMTWTTWFSCAGTWRRWWLSILEIAFWGHQVVVVELFRLIQRPLMLMMMMIMSPLSRETVMADDAFMMIFFYLYLFVLFSRQLLFIHSLYSQNLRMYSFLKHLCPRFGIIDLLFNTNFFWIYLTVWIKYGSYGVEPLAFDISENQFPLVVITTQVIKQRIKVGFTIRTWKNRSKWAKFYSAGQMDVHLMEGDVRLIEMDVHL